MLILAGIIAASLCATVEITRKQKSEKVKSCGCYTTTAPGAHCQPQAKVIRDWNLYPPNTTPFLSSPLPVSSQQVIQCPEHYGVQTYEDPEFCDHFYLCENGTLTHERCENGLLFDGKGAVHNHCNYNWAVDCGQRKADFTPISTPGCEYQFGIYADGPECSTNFIKCEYGVPHSEPCEPGLVYDERIHKCNWPDLLLEKCNPEAVIGFKCPTRLPEHSVAAKYWPYPRFPVPGDCGRLITCVNGFPRLITCGEGKVYDETTGTCEEPELVPKCHGFKK